MNMDIKKIILSGEAVLRDFKAWEQSHPLTIAKSSTNLVPFQSKAELRDSDLTDQDLQELGIVRR